MLTTVTSSTKLEVFYCLSFNILNKTPCRRSLGLHGIGEWAAEWPMQCGDVACWETVLMLDDFHRKCEASYRIGKY